MPQVNLSSLSGPELRALYDATRERGEAAQSYKILQEMAARRADGRGESGGGERGSLFGARRPPEPRVIEVDPGDPEEADDDIPPLPPNWRPTVPGPALKPAAEPAARAQASSPPPRPARRLKAAPPARPPDPPVKVRPVRIAPVKIKPVKVEPVAVEPTPPIAAVHFRHAATEDDPAPAPAGAPEEAMGAAVEEAQAWELPPPEPRPARAGSRRGRFTAVFAGGLAVGAAIGVWVGETIHAPPGQPTVAAFRAAVQPQPPPSQPGPPPAIEAPAVPEPYPEAPPEAPAATAPEASEGASPQSFAQALGGGGACAAQPTPADRTICGNPELRRLQRDLRQAYGRALAVHRDRDLLREHQLAWAIARNGVTDPRVLARLYVQRIRKLNAAAAAAAHAGRR